MRRPTRQPLGPRRPAAVASLAMCAALAGLAGAAERNPGRAGEAGARTIENGGFEDRVKCLWRVNGGGMQSDVIGDGVGLIPLDQTDWRDCELVVEARRIITDGGRLLGMRKDEGKVEDPFAAQIAYDGFVLAVGGEQDRFLLRFGARGNTAHQLERVTADRAKPASQDKRMVSQLTGQVVVGRWYRVRVRCERQRLRAWLDEKLLFDVQYTDGPVAGPFHLGASLSQAEFRNPLVTARDGRILWDGLAAPAQRWLALGQGLIVLSPVLPREGRCCLKIKSDSGETGVYQSRLSLRRNDPWRGSVWVRGKSPEGLIVRWMDGPRMLEEQNLPPPADQWTMFPLEFRPLENVAHATFQIVTRGSAEVYLDQLSLRSGAAHKNDTP